ncbi:MAG: hypothetical protein KKH08_05125 [Candidatus Omnitrophica bacterium]|nr:hypothetical protein [Candidatus Omnitrophota bacterium]
MSREIYPAHLIQEIKSHINLPDMVQRYTVLNGRNKAICPFHKEKTPSLSVNPNKGLWHCFGCGKGGDAINFIMLAESVTFKNAVKLLAFEASISLDNSGKIDKTLQSKWQKRQKELEQAGELEDLFKDLEIDLYADFHKELGRLPSRINRDARDYNKEVSMEIDLDDLDELVKRRVATFKEIKHGIRNV